MGAVSKLGNILPCTQYAVGRISQFMPRLLRHSISYSFQKYPISPLVSLIILKVQQFYGLRITFGVLSACCETVFVNYVQLYKCRSIGIDLLVILFTSAGMFVASTGKNVFPLIIIDFVYSVSPLNLCYVRSHTCSCILIKTRIKIKNHPSFLNHRNNRNFELAIRDRTCLCTCDSRPCSIEME
jgi:hypothetical protein